MKTPLVPSAVRALAAVLVLTITAALVAAPGDGGIGTGPPLPVPPLFQPLGFLSSNFSRKSNAVALSANGRVVVGYGYWNTSVTERAFRWTQIAGMVPIVTTAGASVAQGVSSNGAVVAGWRYSPIGAFRWTSGTGATSLPPGPQQGQSAYAVSADGNVIVGQQDWYGSAIDVVAVKWVGNGWPQFLGLLPGADFSSARAVSADGSVIVGYCSADNGSLSTRRAFHYTDATGMVSLGDLSGGLAYSSATGVSGDGGVVTGYGTTGSNTNDNEAFIWMPGIGMVGLGQPVNGVGSKGLAISPDGTIVVGTARTIFSSEYSAVIWDADHGMRWLEPVLTGQYGLASALQGWKLTYAVGVVDSGSYVYLAGNGVNPDGKSEAWWARLPGPLQ